MATLEQFKMSQEEKKRRTFSKEFKQKKVREIEQRRASISQVSKAYGVSMTSVQKWVHKYGKEKFNTERLIVESLSDTTRIIAYERKIAELERLIGQKQVMIDFQSKMIDLAEEEYGIDIKKKFDKKP